MSNLIARLMSIFSPVIHQTIVTKLSRNEAFQDLAWHGTKAANQAAERAAAEMKSSKIYQTTTTIVKDNVNTIKQTETFRQIQGSEAGKFVSTFINNVKKELKAPQGSDTRLR